MYLHEQQKKIAKSPKRYRVVCAGRRFGKTILSIEEMIFHAVTNNLSKVAYIAPTYQQARDICWEQLKHRLVGIDAEINESRLEIEIPNEFGNRSKIFLRSWDNIETLRGQAFNFLVLDEVASMRNFEIGWKEVLRPTLTDNKGGALFISTPKGYNHFYTLFQKEQTDEDYQSFRFTSYDNPFLDDGEIDKAKEELNEDQFCQEYLADFRKMEGLVYKEFARNIHTFGDEKDVRKAEYVGGVDFGFTNPCAVLSIVKDFDNNYWVMDEWYKTGKTDAEIAEYISQKGYNFVYPDPENPGGIEELRRHHVNIREVMKGKGSIEKGINKVRDLFKQNRLKIHKSCENLIWELETYRYPEKKDNHNEVEIPVKENDHLCDALRYVLMSNKPLAQGVVYQAPRNKTNIAL
jgi:PBSX family phage terminase large subunit